MHMKFKYIAYIFFIFCTISFSQNKERIEISGQIIADSLDVEGVTIFNTTASNGSISDIEGKFTIKVYLNDILEISALQFQKIKVTIDENILKSKAVTIVLIEQVNELNEVVILPFGLSGNLKEDIANAKVLNPNYDALYFGLANLDEFEFLDDYKTEIQNSILTDGKFYNGVDVVSLVSLLAKPFFKSKKDRKNKIKSQTLLAQTKITNVYSEEYLKITLNISEKDIKPFIYYVEENGYDKTILLDEKEFEFIDYMIKQYAAYQKSENAKD